MLVYVGLIENTAKKCSLYMPAAKHVRQWWWWTEHIGLIGRNKKIRIVATHVAVVFLKCLAFLPNFSRAL